MNTSITFSSPEAVLRLETYGNHLHLEIEDQETGDGLHQRIGIDEILPALEKMAAWAAEYRSEPLSIEIGVVQEGDAVLVPARIEITRVGSGFNLTLVDAGSPRRAEIALTTTDWLDLMALWLALYSRMSVNRLMAPALAAADEAVRRKLN